MSRAHVRRRRVLPATFAFLLTITPSAFAQLSPLGPLAGMSWDPHEFRGDLAYHPAHDVYLIAYRQLRAMVPWTAAAFVTRAGVPIAYFDIIGSGVTGVGEADDIRVAYSPEVSDGAGGSGGFIVIRVNFTGVWAHVVGYPNYAGPAIPVSTAAMGAGAADRAAVAYSPVDRQFLVAWAGKGRIGRPASPPQFVRLDINGLPIGSPTLLASQRQCAPTSPSEYACSHVEVAWNPTTNEFGVVYNDNEKVLARIRNDGTIAGRTNLGSGTRFGGLAVNTSTGNYLAVGSTAVCCRPEGTEVSGTGEILTQSEITSVIDAAGQTNVFYDFLLSLSYSSISDTFVLVGTKAGQSYTGSVIELNRHGVALSSSLDLQSNWFVPRAVPPDSVEAEWLLMNSGGRILPVATGTRDEGSNRPAVQVANDFNNDGHADVVWRNDATGQNIIWFMNDAQQIGAAWLPDVLDPKWRMVLIGDFSGDGAPDILWRHAITGENVLWVVSGASVNDAVQWPTLSDPSWMPYGVAEVDGDGRSDVIWRHAVTGERVAWVVVNGVVTNTRAVTPLVHGRFRPVGLIDVNVDGVPEILRRNDVNGVNQVVSVDGTVHATLPPVPDTNWVIAATADFDGDGQDDVLWRHTITGENLVWHLNGSAVRDAAWLPIISDLNWRTPQQLRARAATDINGDGTADILWRHAGTGQNAVWQMAGTSVIATDGLPEVTDLDWKLVAVADFNQDGSPDFVWRHSATGDNVLWLMKGRTVQQTVALPEVAALSWTIAAATDLNADGAPDLIWRNTGTGENVVWYMQGAKVASTAGLPSVADTTWILAATADLNRDHQPDLLWRNNTTGENVVWYMTGAAVLSTASLPSVTDLAWTLALATDIDGDGYVDLLWRNMTTGINAVWFMRVGSVIGTGGFPSVADVQWQIVK